MHLFYTPDINSDLYILSEEESKHGVKVLRLKNGDQVELIDGKGGWYRAEITDAHPKRTLVKVLNKKEEFKKRSYKLHIALAPTKNSVRTEWFLEKATEIGIDSVSFIHCRNSERVVVKTDRLNKIVTSAVKQSLKAYHPLLNELVSFNEMLNEAENFKGQKFIAHCREEQKDHLCKLYKAGKDALILIGPEGDFTREEVNMAMTSGFEQISLGNSRLRTETAALVACHTVSLINEKCS
ncbi:MAG: 16S rRNA (uracil(1498)-N(3))-methyltransferase [Bacteroidetes bacterium]|nr:16S rRNA (uracil(1498)-N(3))-methyltransferase [Bacteroidota bacterium]HET6244572.1 16S rRNA (uracil(1498)-N(3))-methyltransferase [Bacteroidia bacterium]